MKYVRFILLLFFVFVLIQAFNSEKQTKFVNDNVSVGIEKTMQFRWLVAACSKQLSSCHREHRNLNSVV